jgi:LPXTG cell wall anchor motif
MKSVNRIKAVALIFCASLVALTFAPNVEAQTWNKRTIVKFSQQIEIPGVGQKYLPAGTYVFKLVDSVSNRDIVQIFNEDESRVLATILTIANYRLKATDETVMTFRERPVGQPEAIRAWFYPGANWGQEFVYPKSRAVELAKVTQEPVLYVPSEIAPEMAKPVPEEALKQAPIKAVTPKGEEVAVAQVVEPPPVQTASATLPQTASIFPLLGLLGLLSLIVGLVLSVWPKRIA